MAYIKSQGCTVQKQNTTSSPISWDTIGQVVSVSGPDGNVPEVEVTHLASTGKEFIAGLADFGSLQMVVQWDYNTTANQHAALWTDFLAGTSDTYRVVFSDSPQTILTLAGYPSQYSLSLGVDEPVQATIAVRISGAPSIA